jgi:Xaa-Pro dipeptidase
MAEQGVDALVLAQPESITYATGGFPGVASYWRRAGAAFVVVPADPRADMVAIVGDLQEKSFRAASGLTDVRSHRIWVETGSYGGLGDAGAAITGHDRKAGRAMRTPRPAQYDLPAALGLLREALVDRNLLASPIAIELGFIPAEDMAVVRTLLPEPSWTSATRLVERLRAIKSPAEIERLRRAAVFSKAGLEALLDSIAPGMTAAAMTEIWRDAAFAEAAGLNLPPPSSAWAYIAVGGDGFAAGGPAAIGDIIKIDVGCVIDGYSSDGGRTAVLGHASKPQRRVYDSLRRAFDRGLAALRPGEPLGAVYSAAATSMWDDGFETYGRGHFGHGVGSSIWSEEWPFIAAGVADRAEPGMVLAFETPYYIDGLGGFIIEDQLLVTATDCEVMAPYSRDLAEVG